MLVSVRVRSETLILTLILAVPDSEVNVLKYVIPKCGK